MASRNSKTKAGLKAARDAVAATQREVVARAQRNADDLATYFSAQERLAGVEEWLCQRIDGLKSQAAARQLRERTTAGGALKAMRDRGESVREIGRLAGIGEKTVRDLMRLADTGGRANDVRSDGGGARSADEQSESLPSVAPSGATVVAPSA